MSWGSSVSVRWCRVVAGKARLTRRRNARRGKGPCEGGRRLLRLPKSACLLLTCKEAVVLAALTDAVQ